MKVNFEMVQKSFTNQNVEVIKFYVLKRNLIDGSVLEIPIKSDKYKLLNMSLILESKNK